MERALEQLAQVQEREEFDHRCDTRFSLSETVYENARAFLRHLFTKFPECAMPRYSYGPSMLFIEWADLQASVSLHGVAVCLRRHFSVDGAADFVAGCAPRVPDESQ